MVGFDILNITGSVSKSKHKNPFCAVTEDSIMSPTLANSIWASGLEKEWTTANVESDGKPPFLPLLPLGLALQFPGGSSALPSQAPGASTSCSCPLGALSSTFTGETNLLLYIIFELISLLLIRTSSSLSLALICLYSLYSSDIGVRSSFCTFLGGVKRGHEDFCARTSSLSSLPPPADNIRSKTYKTAHLLHYPSGNKNKVIFILGEKTAGARQMYQQSGGSLHVKAEQNPMVLNAKSYLKHVLLHWNCQLLHNSWSKQNKTIQIDEPFPFQEPSECQPARCQNKIQLFLAWNHRKKIFIQISLNLSETQDSMIIQESLRMVGSGKNHRMFWVG